MSLLASVCVAATVLLSTVRGVQISIEAHEEECFYEELKGKGTHTESKAKEKRRENFFFFFPPFTSPSLTSSSSNLSARQFFH
jgi:hypothetical protein